MKGRVHGSEGGVYRVHLESGGIVDATLRGRLKREARTGDKVVIGDLVEVLLDGEGVGTVEAVLPRKTEVVRRGPGGRRPKVVAANVHRLVVVAAAAHPRPNPALLDRLLVVGEANALTTVLVMNKVDLLDEAPGEAPVPDQDGGGGVAEEEEGGEAPGVAELSPLYRGLGYTVLETSATSGVGLRALKDLLCTGISAMVGPSGVGKSTLLNTLQPGLSLKVGELSRKVSRGRHTTVSGRLIALNCGGLVADTPGFSDVGVWGVDPGALSRCFPEFRSLEDACRFRECTHLHEPGCRVREEVEKGGVVPGRFASYRALYAEAEAAARAFPGRFGKRDQD